jgi:bifunctional non-homologous end joining protein LigD
VPWPMLAQSGPLPDEEGYTFEFKLDGMRALARIRRDSGPARSALDPEARTREAKPGAPPPRGGASLQLLSRNDLEQAPRFPELHGMASLGRDVDLDGEIVVFDQGRPSFSFLQDRFGLKDADRIQAAASKQPAHYLAFDILWLDGDDLRDLPLRERRRRLESLGFEGDSWSVLPSHPDGKAVLEASKRLGLEGVVAKRLDAPYEAKRSPSWIKVRNRDRKEYVVGAWTEGASGLGSLLVGHYRGDALHYDGRVGTGFREADVERLRPALRRIASRRLPFVDAPSSRESRGKDAPVHPVHPVLVVEVEHNGWTRHGTLRQASFKGIRIDKDAKDVQEVAWRGPSGAAPSASAS